jgi:PST family polysaccharide transporter
VGVGIAHAIAALAVVAPAYGLVLRRTGVRLSTIGACAARPIIGLVVAGGVAVAVRHLVPDGFLQLAVGGIVVAVAYLSVVFPMRRLLVESTAEFDVMA